LDCDRLQQILQQDQEFWRQPDNLRPRFKIHIFDNLASTNSKLWELLDQGAQPGTVVIARQQQAGRGQWGHQWQSLPGGLYLSLLLSPDLPAQQAMQLTLCSAWGLAQAFRSLGIPLELKWPNDLILQQRKLGGILTETRIQNQRIHSAIVGVGINWTNPTPVSGIQLQHFLGQSRHPWLNGLESLAALTLWAIMHGHQVLQISGIQAILPLYQDLLMHLGQPCAIKGRTGTVVGISENGELRVQFRDSSLPTSEICFKPGSIHLGYG